MANKVTLTKPELIELMVNITRDVLKEQSSSKTIETKYGTSPFPDGKVIRLTPYGVTPIAIEVENGAVIEDYESYFTDWVRGREWEKINNVECKFPHSEDFKGIHQYMNTKGKVTFNGNLDTEWDNFEGDDINTPGGGNRNKHDMPGAPNHSAWNWVSACKYAKLLTYPGFYRNKDLKGVGVGGCCDGKGKYRNDWAGIDKIFTAYNRQGVPPRLLELETSLGTGTEYNNDEYKKDIKDLPGNVGNMLASRMIGIIMLQCKWSTIRKTIPLPYKPDEDEIKAYMEKYPIPVDRYGLEIRGGKNGAFGYSKALKPTPTEVVDEMIVTIKFPEALNKDILPDWLKAKFSELPDPTIWMGTFDWLGKLLESSPIDGDDIDKAILDISKWMEKSAKAVYPYYHYAIDAISFIAYLLCPWSAGIGCAISVAADILNAYLYVVDDNDYYMAGMQMAFAIVPGGEFIKYSSVWLKPYLMPVFRAGVFKLPAEAVKKTVNSALKRMSIAEKEAAKKIFTKTHLEAIKTMLRTMNAAIKPYFKKVKFLEEMWEKCNMMCRALIIFMELLWYDPALPAQLLELISKEGSVLHSLSDWMKTWPKPLLSVWSSGLASAENFRAAITTTPYDCTGNMFVWLQKDMNSDGDACVEQSWLKDGYKEEDFNAENVWREFKTGWRPRDLVSDLVFIYNLEIKDNAKLMKEYDIYLKDCITFIQYMESKDEGDVKMMYLILTELGWTDSQIEELRDVLSGVKQEEVLKKKIAHTKSLETK